jgi:DNA ligase-1
VAENDDLVPFTKAYSGLTDAEFAEITRWVRKNTTERFGPVRGQARACLRDRLRGHPGIHPPQVRRRAALPPHGALAPRQAASEANTLDDLKAMLAKYG